MPGVPTPSPRTRLTAAQRRVAILDAAMEAFAASGYHGTSIDDIASTAGISKALIYEHFDSKRELHATLVAEQAQELFDRLAANALAGESGAQRLRGGVEAFLGFVEERREGWRALFRDAADPEMGEVFDRVQNQATAAIAALMRADAATPPASDRDLEMIARQLSGAVQALANWWYEHPDVPRSVVIDRVMDFAWVGLGGLRDGKTWPRG